MTKKQDFCIINPGAAGYNGFHKFMTAIRFQIDGKNIHDLELIELGERRKRYFISPLRFPESSSGLLFDILWRNLPACPQQQSCKYKVLLQMIRDVSCHSVLVLAIIVLKLLFPACVIITPLKYEK